MHELRVLPSAGKAAVVEIDVSLLEGALEGLDREGVRWVLQTPLRVYAELDATLSAEMKEAKRRGEGACVRFRRMAGGWCGWG